jgi:hypothetical protein
VSDSHFRAGLFVSYLDGCIQLLGQRFNDPGAEPRLGISFGSHTVPVVAYRQRPTFVAG